MKRSKHPNKDIEEAILYAEKMDGGIRNRVNHLIHGEGYFVHCLQGKDIKCQYGQHLEILLITHNKFVD